MASCQVQGEPDLYGLGIRVAFYIQWFGAIVIEYLGMADLPDIRLIGLLFSAAAFLGLIIKLSVATALQPADVYIVLLLAMGIYLPLVPLYLWKAATCFNRYWDPFRWSEETPSPAFKGLNFTLLLAIASLAVWYWCSFAPEHPCSGEQYGFFFSRVSLGNKAFVAFNAIMYFVILFVCLVVFLRKVGWKVPFWRERRKKRRVKRMHVMAIKEMKTLSNVAVAATLIAAVELAVVWNRIPDVNNVADVAQVLPLLVSAGFFVRILFLHFAGVSGGSDSSEEDSDGGSHSYMTESQGGLPPAPPPVHAR
ncbi:hypothetical protein CORC01_03275 [Colletotrichum orchidophilum]|uniref:Uncharacterized protein n=1 Tax=Colletotrichum orchidophilum TaxID=1209926 RepID=A0A1G4BJ97_9PEZI|nr:uncharacterized protein CORC01_03275 [Colletotrichum orchidophilum]OHF01519.1 hypothetical protein CORC01_03275 [Colletotrichum orchidophilum]